MKCSGGILSNITKQARVWFKPKCRAYSAENKNEKKGKTGDKSMTVVQKPMEPCKLPGDIEQPSVIIIGAGMAGLSAAQRLTQCGLRRFRVLEGSERPGGRVKTGWMSDSVVELGAQWISGASVVNPVFTMAVQEKLIDRPLARTTEPDGPIFTSDGRVIGQEMMELVQPRFWAMASKAAALFSCTDKVSYTSLNSYFDELLLLDSKNVLNCDLEETKRVFYGFFSSLKAKLGDELSNVNAKFFGSFHEVPGGNARIGLGMGGLLAPMLRGLPSCSVVYCKPVHCVRWGTAGPGFPRAVVVCCDGEEIGADYVIVTVPLGVLKSRDNFFCPDLPAKKMDAIKNLGFGHVDKIFMQYDAPFWNANVKGSGMRLAWTPEELKRKDYWWKDVCEFSVVPGSKKLYCATVAGEGAKVMERLPDKEVIQGLTRTLRRFTNDRSIPPPIAIMRSSWSTFPYSYGAYTCMSLNSSTGNIRDIASPLPDECEDIPPIILFAGEHTHSTEYATLQGARRTGFREADRIIRLTLKYKGSPNKEPPCPPCPTPPPPPPCPPC